MLNAHHIVSIISVTLILMSIVSIRIMQYLVRTSWDHAVSYVGIIGVLLGSYVIL